MSSLQFYGCRALDRPLSSPFWGGGSRFLSRARAVGHGEKVRFAGLRGRFCAMSSDSPSFRMNLNEYMVTLEKPLGIRFALSSDGKIFVHSLKRGVRVLLCCFGKLVTFPSLLPFSLRIFTLYLSFGHANYSFFSPATLFTHVNCRRLCE